jgi:hypothetical protein
MKRVIVDYKKLTPEIVSMLVQKYPDGYGDKDIITFKNSKNQTVEAVEVKTEDTNYLVKISTRLQNTMDDFDIDDYDASELNEALVDLPQNESDSDD